MNLDNEQKQIFINFIDSFKDIVRDNRYKFVASHLSDDTTLIGHPLKPDSDITLYKIDFEALCRSKLFDCYDFNNPNEMQFIITHEAFNVYELLKNEKLTPLQRIENDTLDYIKSQCFIKKYPKAYQKWQMAEELFLKETKNKNLTTIGHLCRETLQEFADELLLHKSIESEFSKSKIISKIKSVFEATNIGSTTTKHFLDALLNYWGALSDLVQKQEHDSQREGGTLKIEDARRIIFHSAIIMYEIDKTI
jgi:hypothetical protein